MLTACGEPQPADKGTPAIAQPESAAWTPTTAWRLSAEPIVHIKGSTENAEESPLDPVSVVRLADGRYVVADGDQNGWDALLVYDQKGKFIEQWGRDGQGPGEFKQLFMWGSTYRGDSIAAFDFPDNGIEIFAPDGQHARLLKLPPFRRTRRAPAGTTWFTDVFVGALRDGRVLNLSASTLDTSAGPGPAWYRPDLLIYDADGQNPRRLATLPSYASWWDGKRARDYIFQSNALTRAGREVWYHAPGDSFRIGVFDADGKLLRTLRRVYTRERVSPEDRENMIRHQVEQARTRRFEGGAEIAKRTETYLRTGAHFADWKPIYTSMMEDSEQNLWVEHYRWIYAKEFGPSRKPGRWSVFDRSGQFLGEVEMPPSFIVSSITNDQVLGFWQDEFDVEHVRVYGLIKPQPQ